MVKNGEAVRRLERAVTRKERPDLKKNMRLVESLHKEAVSLGVFPPQDRLSGIEVDIRIARAINRVSKTP